MTNLPTGTVTFLFTDIEGSTKLWEQFPDLMRQAFARQEAIVRAAMTAHGGYVYKMIGDAFQVAFAAALDALAAALDAQHALHAEDWGEIGPIRVRMALHTGVTEERGDDYVGPTLNRVARLMSAGHGGQVLLSQTTYDLVCDHLPRGVTLRDMGERRLKDIVRPEHVYQLIASDLPQDFPPLKTLDAHPNNLPEPLTRFIGRAKQIEQIKGRLADSRLVTLAGSGGIGKTRLAIQTARELLPHYPDGAWLVELAPLNSAELVPQTVAGVLSVREEQGRPLLITLADHLHEKNLLLVLDNCEHIIDACAQLAEYLLEHCPGLRILASSREALGVEGEAAIRVPSLSFPDAGRVALDTLAESEAAQLFVDRAMAVLPDFTLTVANAPAVAQVCQRLDGVALAIELAASRVKALKVEQIAVRLDDAFRLLTGGSRTALPRQQTLRATIDWSYSLLSDSERVLLRRLAVFAGGWTLEAAESVCAGNGADEHDILDLLTQLANKSLVVVEREPGSDVRYSLLETTRQYAREKLMETGEVEALRNRHLTHYLQLAESAEAELHQRNQAQWLSRLELEHDNIRAALDWAVKEQPEYGLRLAVSLSEFWDTHGHLTEGRKWLEAVLKAADNLPPTPTRVKALYGAMGLAVRQTDVASGLALSAEGFALAQALDYKPGIADGFAFRGMMAEHFDNDMTRADAFYDQALELWRTLGDRRRIGQALGPLAARALRHYNYAEAEKLFAESLSLFREVEDEREIAGALWNLAEVANLRGDYELARTRADDSLVLFNARAHWLGRP